jgi:hypothetical protein
MSIKKIGDLVRKEICDHPEHNIPSLISLPPGIYEHTCPKCSMKIVFTVQSTGTLL